MKCFGQLSYQDCQLTIFPATDYVNQQFDRVDRISAKLLDHCLVMREIVHLPPPSKTTYDIRMDHFQKSYNSL